MTDTDPSHYFGALPGIALAKQTNGQDADTPPGPEVAAGHPVTWTYAVTNTGNVTLTEVNVTDDQGVTVSCPGTELTPGAGMVCRATGTATEGQYANQGTATASPPGGLDAVSGDDASHYLGRDISIAVEKFTNGVDADAPPGQTIRVGRPVQWTYVVTNTGTVALSDVSVVDDAGTPEVPGDDYTCHIGALPAGGVDSATCSYTGSAQEGPYSNLATAVGFYGAVRVSDSDPSHYLGSGGWYDVYLPLVQR